MLQQRRMCAVFVWRPNKHQQTPLACRKTVHFWSRVLGCLGACCSLKRKKDFLFLFKSARTQAPATKTRVLQNWSLQNRVLMGCLLRCLRDELCKKVGFAEGVSPKTGACVTQIASRSVSMRMLWHNPLSSPQDIPSSKLISRLMQQRPSSMLG